jgi:hypothetical protein
VDNRFWQEATHVFFRGGARRQGDLEHWRCGRSASRALPEARRTRRWSEATLRAEAKSGSEGFLPILHWLPRYERRWLRADIIAGVAVVAMIVPKNLGYAEIAGVPVQNGLYAAAAAAIIYALFCTSRQISTGPSSALATVAGGAVIVTGVTGGDAAQLVAAITLVTGILLLLLALFRMGWIAPWSPGSWPGPRSTWSSASCRS